jgi:hypothetical protein
VMKIEKKPQKNKNAFMTVSFGLRLRFKLIEIMLFIERSSIVGIRDTVFLKDNTDTCLPSPGRRGKG